MARFSSAPSPSRIQIGVALLLTALSVALHGGFLLDHPALWRDEINSVGLATMPTLRELWLSLSFDSSPVLWPLVLRGWILVAGQSDFSLRFIGFCVQMLLIGGLWFASLSVNRRAPVISLFLLGCQPAIALWPSLRSYGLGAALILWTMGAMWRGLDDSGENSTAKWRAATLVLAFLSVQCVYANVLLLAAIIAGAVALCLSRGERKTARFPLWVGLLAALSMLIYIPTLQRIAPWQITTLQPIPAHSIVSSLVATLRAAGDLMAWIWIAGFAVFLLAAPVVFALSRRRKPVDAPPNREGNGALVYGFVISTVGFGVMTLFFIRAGRATFPWHYVGLLAILGSNLDFLAAGVLRNAKTQIALPIFAAILTLCNFPFHRRDVAVKRTNIDVLARRLDALAAPSDLVVVSPFSDGVTYARYSIQKTPWAMAPDIGHSKIQRYDVLKRLMETPNSLARVENLIAKTLKSGHRVWLLGAFPVAPEAAPRYIEPKKAPKYAYFAPRYETYCPAQIAYFLAQHRAHRTAVPVPLEGRFNPLEVARIERVEGWSVKDEG